MHASYDSPCHLSAKHCFLDTCFLLTGPFRVMLLTLMSGHQCLGPRAYGVPVHLIALLHSYFALHGARPPTTTPYPPLLEALGFRWALAYLLSTPLNIL